MNTQNEIELKKLRWRCHRGMLELDMLLLAFFDAQSEQLTAAERDVFTELLEADDPTLYDWLLGQSQPEDKGLQQLVKRIRHQH